MRTHTLLTKVASVAVCFGVLLSGPVMAGANGIIKDVELSKDGVLYGQVYTPTGQVVPNTVVKLQYQGKAVAAAKSNENGQFAISGVRAGAHEVVVGPLRNPVRLWSHGSAPGSATKGIVLPIDEAIVRGQQFDDGVIVNDGIIVGDGVTTNGFGLLDVITLATVGSAVGALVISIDNNNKLDKIQGQITPASP